MEDKIVVRCANCGEELDDCEMAVKINDEDEVPGEYVCETCLERMCVDEIIKLFNREILPVREHREWEEMYTW